MSIAVYSKGSVSYPTGVYEQYNRYLIKEYENFYLWLDKSSLGNKETSMRLVLREITDLNYLLSENTSETGEDFVKVFNVTTWEDSLTRSYRLLNRILTYNNMKGIKKIEFFLRKEKLNRIKKAVK